MSKTFRLETMAQVRRVYEVQANDEDEASEMVEQNVGMVHEEDISEDIDSCVELKGEAK